MEYPLKHDLPYEETQNGALILLLLRHSKTWEELCARYAYTNPCSNTSQTISLLQKLRDLRDLGFISFDEADTENGRRRPIGEIKETGLWSQIQVALGGMRLTEAALLSRHSRGIAVAPEFGRPRRPAEKIDIFVLMPFNAKMEKVYFNHIKGMGKELGLTIQRADEVFSPGPFMEKVWDGICAAQLVLADCTERNPNVFYEIGIAHTVGRKVVLITRSTEDIPSDIKHFDYIPYVYDPEGTEALIERLRGFVRSYFNV